MHVPFYVFVLFVFVISSSLSHSVLVVAVFLAFPFSCFLPCVFSLPPVLLVCFCSYGVFRAGCPASSALRVVCRSWSVDRLWCGAPRCLIRLCYVRYAGVRGSCEGSCGSVSLVGFVCVGVCYCVGVARVWVSHQCCRACPSKGGAQG